MKKVLLINDFNNGGGCEVVFNYTYELLKNDFEIHKFIGAEKHTKPQNPFEYIFSFKFKKLLTKELESFKPDIIHLKNYYHLLSPSILFSIKKYKTKNPNLKVIYTAHDYHLICPNSGFSYYQNQTLKYFTQLPTFFDLLSKKMDYRGRFHSLLKKVQWILAYQILKLHKSIDIIVSPSHFLKNILDIKFSSSKILVIRNPINFIINEQNKDTSKLKMVFVGRLSHEKGLVGFIDAIKGLDIEYQFDIYGDGDELDKIKLFIENECLNKRINLKGRLAQDQILNIYKNYNTLVLPSIWLENAPLSIIEAGLAGLNILTSNHGGCEEMANHFDKKYLFDVRNPNSILEETRRCYVELAHINSTDFDLISNEFSILNYKANLMNLYSL